MSLQIPKFTRNARSDTTPSWDDDLLNRKELASKLEMLIANSSGPYVIAMTSEWGSGKTFFLKAWEKDLTERVLPCVYFNAWESDHVGDPLLALTGCITETLRCKGYLCKETPTRLEALATTLAQKSPRLVAKCLIGWGNHITDGALAEFKDDLVNSLELGTKLFLENEARRKDFSKQLASTVEVVSSCLAVCKEGEVDDFRSFPLFVMIDELDRCRPNYTIELLESIKHLFNVKGVVFLLSIDGEQIFSVIEHAFGLKSTEYSDSRKDYLQKFIDVFWHMPSSNTFDFALTILIEKQLKIPSDWSIKGVPIDRLTQISHDLSFEQGSFYEVLAAMISNTKINLRACLQAIERIHILSSIYDLSWKEYLTIFLIFSTGVVVKSSSDVLDLIGKGLFTKKQLADGIQKVVAEGIYSKKLSSLLLMHIKTKKFIIQDSSKENLDKDVGRSFAQLSSPFSGEGLSESVALKIGFLKDFGFEASPPNTMD